MKRALIFLALIAVSITSKGQMFSGSLTAITTGPTWTNQEVVSTRDTIVLNAGDQNCIHKYAYKIESLAGYATSCAVMHGPEGCEANWGNDFRICTICLRHENIKETRTTKVKPDEYKEALKRLKQ